MIRFGNRVEMMVDGYLIEKKENVSFRKTEPLDKGKVISFDAVWEDPGSLGLTVIDEQDSVKLYYRGFPRVQTDESDRQTSCLAVSGDGLRFEKYPVNRIDYDGIKENNIVKMDTFCHNFAPFFDANPECKPEERYKAIGGIKPQGGIFAFASEDGLSWRMLSEKPIVTRGAFDSMNIAFWNPHTKKYHCYSRYFDKQAKSERCPAGCRAIQSCTSEDFLHWTDPVPNEYEDGLADQLYTNAAGVIPGAEHIMISLPMRFQEQRQKVMTFNGNAYGNRGVSDAILMTSRDGVFWDRTVADAWLSGGLCEKEWTQRNFIPCAGIVTRGDWFYFYVEKHYMWDDDGIWAYAVPKYRLISLYADTRGGSFTTKLLQFDSDSIFLNYSTSAYGYVKVTVLDESGAELFVSDELYGNELSHKLCVEGLGGKKGRLKIELNEAHLYAMGSDMN